MAKNKAGRPINYQTYLTERNKLISKRYILDAALSKADYIKMYKGAKIRGLTNIARTIATSDIAVEKDIAGELYSELQRLEIVDPEKAATLSKLLGNPRNKTAIMKIGLKDSLIRHATRTGNVFIGDVPIPVYEIKSDRQAAFMLMWALKGKKGADDSYGY